MILLPLAVGMLIGAVTVLLVGIFFYINDGDVEEEFINDELMNWRD